ncbi:hypothetical protein V5799_000645 [Amblyomma americanum]|uniref:Ig-like domain-containing protein n=1 Tax=Amblyomma americanum TaxID=6943 RepID=A0AAQ4D2H4_AMBAM
MNYRKLRLAAQVPQETLRLHCPVSAPEGESVTWFKGGEELFPDDDRFVAAGRTLEIRTANDEDAGAYGCSTRGSNNSSVAHVLQLVTPVRLEPPQSTVAAPLGARVQLECHAYARPVPHVSWLFGDRSRVSSPLLSVDNASAAHSGSYKCSAWHERCPRLVAESDVTLNVFESTIRTNEGFPGSGITLTPGADALRLKCDYPADRTAKIVWLKENATLPSSGGKYALDEEDQSLVINKPERSDVGNYSCVALGRVFNETALIVVGLKVAIRTSHSKPFKEGQDGFMSCMVNEYPKPTIRWYRNGHLLSAYRNSKFKYGGKLSDEYETLVVRRLDKRDEALFTCLVDNGHSQDRASFYLRVTIPPSPLTPFYFICAEVVIMTGIAYIFDRRIRGAWIAAQEKPPEKRERRSPKKKKKKSFTDSDIFRFIQCVESSGDLVLDDLDVPSEKPQSKDLDTAVGEKAPKLALIASGKPDTAIEPHVGFKPSEKTDENTSSRKKKRRKKKGIGEDTQEERSQLAPSGPASFPAEEEIIKETSPKPEKELAIDGPAPSRKKQRRRVPGKSDTSKGTPSTTPLEKEGAEQVGEEPIVELPLLPEEGKKPKARGAAEEPPAELDSSRKKAKVKQTSKEPFTLSPAQKAEDIVDRPTLEGAEGSVPPTTFSVQPKKAGMKKPPKPLLHTERREMFDGMQHRKDSVTTMIGDEERPQVVHDTQKEKEGGSCDATGSFLLEDEQFGWPSVEHKFVESNEPKPTFRTGETPQVGHGFVENTMEEGRTLGSAKQRKGKKRGRASEDKTADSPGSPEKAEFFFGAHSTPTKNVQVFSAPSAKDSQDVRSANVDERRMIEEKKSTEILKHGDFSTHDEKGELPIIEAYRCPPVPVMVPQPPTLEAEPPMDSKRIGFIQPPEEKRVHTMPESSPVVFKSDEIARADAIRFNQPLEEKQLRIPELEPASFKPGKTPNEIKTVPLEPPASVKVLFPEPTTDSPPLKPASKKYGTSVESDSHSGYESPSPIPSPEEVFVQSRRLSRILPVVTKMPFPRTQKSNELHERGAEGELDEPKEAWPVASGGKNDKLEEYTGYPTLPLKESYMGSLAYNEGSDRLEAVQADQKGCEPKEAVVTPLFPTERVVKVAERELPEESRTQPPSLPDTAVKVTKDTRLSDSGKDTDPSRLIVSVEQLESSPGPLAHFKEGGGVTTKPVQHPVALDTSPQKAAARAKDGRIDRKKDHQSERKLVERPKSGYAVDKRFEGNIDPFEHPAETSPEGAYGQRGVSPPKSESDQRATTTTGSTGHSSPHEDTLKQAYGAIGQQQAKKTKPLDKQTAPLAPQEPGSRAKAERKVQPMKGRAPERSPAEYAPSEIIAPTTPQKVTSRRTSEQGLETMGIRTPENMGQLVETIEGAPSSRGAFDAAVPEGRRSVAEQDTSSHRTTEPKGTVESRVVENVDALVGIPQRTISDSSLVESTAAESTVLDSDTSVTEEHKAGEQEGEPLRSGIEKMGPLVEIQERGPSQTMSPHFAMAEDAASGAQKRSKVGQPHVAEETSATESTAHQATTLASTTTESIASGSDDRRLVERLPHPVVTRDSPSGEGSFADDDFDTMEEQITLYEGLHVPDYTHTPSSEAEYEPPQPSELFSTTASPDSDWTQEPDQYYFLCLPPFEFAIPRTEIDGPERVPDTVAKRSRSSKRRRSSSRRRKQRRSQHHSKHGAENPSGAATPASEGSSPGTSARQPDSGQPRADAPQPSTSRDEGRQQDRGRPPQVRDVKGKKSKSRKEKRK